MLASFLLIGDSVVTFLDLSAGTAGWFSFLSLLEAPPYAVRGLLCLVAGSALSCRAHAFISETWSPVLADVYTAAPVTVLVVGVLTLFLWKLPLLNRMAWLSPMHKLQDPRLNWTPNVAKYRVVAK